MSTTCRDPEPVNTLSCPADWSQPAAFPQDILCRAGHLLNSNSLLPHVWPRSSPPISSCLCPKHWQGDVTESLPESEVCNSGSQDTCCGSPTHGTLPRTPPGCHLPAHQEARHLQLLPTAVLRMELPISAFGCSGCGPASGSPFSLREQVPGEGWV